jgi:hypothetical protein|nr:MAG TPA: copper amine oxidase [Caudoviricetes sp.]
MVITMKKTIATLMSLTAACAMFTPAFAVETESPTLISKPPAVISEAPEETTGRYTFEINGKDVPVDAVIIVPLRTIAEQLGFTVTWNGDGTVTVDSGEMHTTITIGEDSYQAITSIEGAVGATAPLSLGAAPYVVDGTTYVPLEMFNVLLGNGAVDLEDGKIVINTEINENNVQIPSPFIDCASLAEAGEVAGFEMRAPESVGDYDRVFISAIDGELIDVLYESGADTICVRKGTGSEDISGDYNSYAEAAVSEMDGMEVTMKGDAGKVNLAVWTNGEYTYSVSASAGMSRGEMTDLIREIA